MIQETPPTRLPKHATENSQMHPTILGPDPLPSPHPGLACAPASAHHTARAHTHVTRVCAQPAAVPQAPLALWPASMVEPKVYGEASRPVGDGARKGDNKKADRYFAWI